MKKILICTLFISLAISGYSQITGIGGMLMKRNNTLYTVDDVLLADLSYSWWSDPTSILVDDSVNYFSAVDMSGNQNVYRSDLYGNITSTTVHTGLATDEHNAPALLVQDTMIIAAYTGHNTSNFWITKLSRDLQTNYGETNIAAAAGFSYCTYAQIFESSGKIFIFTRCTDYAWNLAWSDDNGDTWDGVQFITKNIAIITYHLYLNALQTSDNIIKMGIYHHPSSGDANEMYNLQLDTSTGDVTSFGVNKGNIYSGWTPISVHTLNTIFEAPTDHSFRFLDLAINDSLAYYLIAEFPIDTIDSGLYKMIVYNYNSSSVVGIYDLIEHGTDTYLTYFGGAYFVKNNNGRWDRNGVFLCRESGGIWYAEKYRFDGSQFNREEVLDTLEAGVDGLSLTRPKPPINAVSNGIRVIYQKGDYDESYTSWDNDLVIKYFRSDTEPPSTPVLAVTPTSLDFGTTTTDLTFDISNSGANTLTWSISDDMSWLSLDNTSGTTTTETDQITATVDRTELSANTYTGTISVTSDGGDQDISVSMTVPSTGGLVDYLAASWEFDEASGTAFYDSHSTNDGTTNATVNQTGHIGTAFAYNGSSTHSYLAAGSDVASNYGTNDITISAWIYINTNTLDQTIYSSASLPPEAGITWRVRNTGVMRAVVGANTAASGSRSYRDSGTALTTGVWHHVVLVWTNATGAIDYYVDGSLDNGAYGEQTGAGDDLSNTDRITDIGANTVSSRWYLNGMIDQIDVFYKAADTDDIFYLWNSGAGRATSDL